MKIIYLLVADDWDILIYKKKKIHSAEKHDP